MMEWHEDALCAQVDPELFFPDKNASSKDIAHAKQVCDECPVKTLCLEWAIQTRQRFGIWGGEVTDARQRIIRSRGLQWDDDDMEGAA